MRAERSSGMSMNRSAVTSKVSRYWNSSCLESSFYVDQ
jgi:hypothetical protein